MNNKEQNNGRESEIRNLRIAKIARLEDAKMKAFVDPSSVKQDFTLLQVNTDFSELEKSTETKSIVGRIITKRGAGKISFATIFDGTGRFQVVLKSDILGTEKIKSFDKVFDMGDFAEFSGTFFVTEKGQESMEVSDFRMLTKTLLPLPEKWHGLQDKEEKYRKRYLDLISDEDTFKRFQTRAKIISEIRRMLDDKGFLEVETPILQNQASGAMAETFNTHHNDYDLDMVLRISLEAEHKMIMAGGYPAVYEIGKIFRNEGSDSTHMQEFTMIEWYKAYKGLDYNMDLTESMLKNIAQKVVGKTEFTMESAAGDSVSIDFGKTWERLEFNDLIVEYANINPKNASREQLEAKAIDLGENKEGIKKMSIGNILDSIWKKSARRKIIQPTWIVHYPGSLKPLAIQNTDGTSETTQLVIAGFELSNHYAELVDPLKQKELLEVQVKAKADGDEEAMDMNNEFLIAMEHGMPPMTGTGIGIDRLVGIFTEQNNLRDTILFPIMKPIIPELSKNQLKKLKEKEKKNSKKAL
jgi:lysyl-tRNA synthetase class 2